MWSAARTHRHLADEILKQPGREGLALKHLGLRPSSLPKWGAQGSSPQPSPFLLKEIPKDFTIICFLILKEKGNNIYFYESDKQLSKSKL